MKRKTKKKKVTKRKYPNYRFVLQWNYKLSNYGKLRWRNHGYYKTKPKAKIDLKKERNKGGIYRHRIKKRW